MNLLNTLLGAPLGYIIYTAYQLTENFGISLLIFAFIIRVVLLPLNIIAHNNSIRFLQLQPELSNIKRRYTVDREKQSQAQYELFKQNKYNPFVGIIPLLVQLLVLIGVLQVIYHPMQHILHLSRDEITTHIQAAGEVIKVLPSISEELFALEALGIMDLSILGVNLGRTPSFSNPSPELLVPVLAGLSMLLYSICQYFYSPGTFSQSKTLNIWMTIIMMVFSIYFTYVTPSSVGIYWTATNVFNIGILFLLNILYNPKIIAGDALAQIKAERKPPQKLHRERKHKKELRKWEKQDATRFREAKKRLVFYALTGGQYKYYKTIIDYILKHSDITIHYLTNDPNDALFRNTTERLIVYYASEKKTAFLLLKLDCDIFVTTVSDLGSFHMKRSIVRDDIEYIYIIHGAGIGGLATGREGTLDNYDTIFCSGPKNVMEMRKREEVAGLPRKTLVKAGSVIYDQLVEAYSTISHIVNDRPQILIAPSWQDDNILDLCIDDVLQALIGKGYKVIIRPHPQYIEMFPERMQILSENYNSYIADGELTFELNLSDNDSIIRSDVLITDWSNIAFDFSCSTLKPCISINTPRKILNPNYKLYEDEDAPEHLALRERIGITVDTDNIKELSNIVEHLLSERDSYKEQIQRVISDTLYHPGRSGEAGGKYILSRLD